jgi:hypothetical protein
VVVDSMISSAWRIRKNIPHLETPKYERIVAIANIIEPERHK